MGKKLPIQLPKAVRNPGTPATEAIRVSRSAGIGVGGKGRTCDWEWGKHCVVKTPQGFDHYKGSKRIAQHKSLGIAQVHAVVDTWVSDTFTRKK